MIITHLIDDNSPSVASQCS